MRGTSAIVGVGESTYYRPGAAPESEFQLACIAIRNAAEDAGIRVQDIDGFVAYANDRNETNRLSTALGVDATRFSALAWGGGGNGVCGTLVMADAAVTAGYANYIVCFRSLAQGQFGRFGQGRMGNVARAEGDNAYRVPYGLTTPAMWYAMIAKRFMHEHGISQDALMEISLASYEHAQRNPRAVRYGRGITAADYRNSRWIVEPYHLFDCCQENDGAAAVIVTSAARARDMKNRPVYIRAAAQGHEFRAAAGGASGAGYNDPEFPTAHLQHVGTDLWKRASIGPEDVQVAQFYENFTGMVVMAICEMGFSTPEKVEDWLKAGNVRWPNGRLPINTSGGNLAEAYIHGFQLVNEAARQVRGESTCQVKDVVNSLVVSGPGALPASVAILSAEAA
jgi:acetyl-CoA acetyltransferase